MAVSHKTTIAFSLVLIPISIYTATQDNDINFNQLHKVDNLRIIKSVQKVDYLPFKDLSKINENDILIEPKLVCIVKYMEKTKTGGSFGAINKTFLPLYFFQYLITIYQ